MNTNYSLEAKEVITINGIDLPVLPTDISFFSDNRLLEEPYIRAPGAITFRSKHSESMLTMSFAFPLMELATPDKCDPQQRELAEKGLQLIVALNNYPFCFIKSNRLDSYLGLHNLKKDDVEPGMGGPDDDVLMFGVKKISLSLDARVPGILLLEVQLLFNNHRILTPSMVVNLNSSNLEGATSPIGLNQFLEILSNDAIQETRMILQTSGEALARSNFSTFHALSQVRLLVPTILNLEEYGVSADHNLNPNSLTGNINNLPFSPDADNLKLFRMPNPLVTPALYVNAEDYSELSDYPASSSYQTSEFDKDPEEIAVTNSNAHPLFAVFWSEDEFAYDNNINAIQNIVLEKERAFAAQMIGAYQHPILQFMGHYPARLSINSVYLSNNYDESKSIHYLYKILLGVVDANNVKYPLANAFNYVKISSVLTSIMGIKNFIPHQSQIEAQSSTGGLESFTCMFIENSMDKMKESAQIGIGRELVSIENSLIIESVIIDYLNRFDTFKQSGAALTPQEELFHNNVLDGIIRVLAALRGEVEDYTFQMTGSQPTVNNIPTANLVDNPMNPENGSGSESGSVNTTAGGGAGAEDFVRVTN